MISFCRGILILCLVAQSAAGKLVSFLCDVNHVNVKKTTYTYMKFTGFIYINSPLCF